MEMSEAQILPPSRTTRVGGTQRAGQRVKALHLAVLGSPPRPNLLDL
jgi:hypothetical protein